MSNLKFWDPILPWYVFLYAVIVEFLLLPLKTNVQVTLIHEMEISNEEDETETGNEEK